MIINDANLSIIAKGFKTVYGESFDATVSYKDTLAMTVGSQSGEETYGWLGQFPALREWIGSRHIKELSAHGFTIKNRKFESTVKVKRDDISDDKYGIYKPMFAEMGRVAKQHPDTLLFKLLADGFTTNGFDGQFFFDSDHSEYYALDATLPSASVSNMQAGTSSPWFLLDLSKAIKPMIWQDREPYDFQAVVDDKDYSVFMRDDYMYGIRARANCGFGLWQLAFGSKQPLTPANFQAAYRAMSKFAGERGQKLGITPTHLVCSSDNIFAARELLVSDQIGGTTNLNKGLCEIISTPFLD